MYVGNIAAFTIASCLVIFKVDTQEGREMHGGGIQGLSPWSRAHVANHPRFSSLISTNSETGSSGDPVAIILGGANNAKSKQNEIRRQGTGTKGSLVVIPNPSSQIEPISIVLPSPTTAGKVKTVKRKKNNKKAKRRKKMRRRKERGKKKRKNRERKQRRLKKQQRFSQGELIGPATFDIHVEDPLNLNQENKKWLKRRRRILERMRSRKAKLDEIRAKEAKIRAEKQRMKKERQDKLEATRAKAVNLNNEAGAGTLVLDGSPIKIAKPKKVFEGRKNTKSIHVQSNAASNEASGSNKILNDKGKIDTSAQSINVNDGNINESIVERSNQDKLNRWHQDHGFQTDNTSSNENVVAIGTEGAKETVRNSTFNNPIVPSLKTSNSIQEKNQTSTKESGTSKDRVRGNIGSSHFLAPTSPDGMPLSNQVTNESNNPTGSIEIAKGSSLIIVDPRRTGVLLTDSHSNVGTGTKIRIVDPRTGEQVERVGAGISNLLGQKPETGVILKSETVAPTDPAKPMDLQIIASNEKMLSVKGIQESNNSSVNDASSQKGEVLTDVQVGLPLEPLTSQKRQFSSMEANASDLLIRGNNGSKVHNDKPGDTAIDHLNSSEAERPIFADGGSLPLNGSTSIHSGELIGHNIESFTAGVPLGVANTGAGDPLGTPALDSAPDTEDNWFDPSFGSSQAAVFQPVDLSEFLSTGNLRTLETNPASSDQHKPTRGIQTVNGEIMPVASQSNSPRTSSNSGKSQSSSSSSLPPSLLGIVFDISRSLRPSRG